MKGTGVRSFTEITPYKAFLPRSRPSSRLLPVLRGNESGRGLASGQSGSSQGRDVIPLTSVPGHRTPGEEGVGTLTGRATYREDPSVTDPGVNSCRHPSNDRTDPFRSVLSVSGKDRDRTPCV